MLYLYINEEKRYMWYGKYDTYDPIEDIRDDIERLKRRIVSHETMINNPLLLEYQEDLNKILNIEEKICMI